MGGCGVGGGVQRNCVTVPLRSKIGIVNVNGGLIQTENQPAGSLELGNPIQRYL